MAQSLEELILSHKEIKQIQSEITSTVKSATLMAADDKFEGKASAGAQPAPLRLFGHPELVTS